MDNHRHKPREKSADKSKGKFTAHYRPVDRHFVNRLAGLFTGWGKRGEIFFDSWPGRLIQRVAFGASFAATLFIAGEIGQRRFVPDMHRANNLNKFYKYII